MSRGGLRTDRVLVYDYLFKNFPSCVQQEKKNWARDEQFSFRHGISSCTSPGHMVEMHQMENIFSCLALNVFFLWFQHFKNH